MDRRRRGPDVLAWIALAWVLGAVVLLALVPVGESSVRGVDSSGRAYERTSHETLLESEGSGVLVVLAVPVVLVGAAVAARRRPWVRRAVGGLLLVGCILGALSIGLLFLPAAVLVLASAGGAAGDPARDPTRDQVGPGPPSPKAA